MSVAAVMLVGAAALVLSALNKNISYFYTPTALLEEPTAPTSRIRLGGLVLAGSIERGDAVTTTFTISDGQSAINVAYSGILPDLFREGQGVIAQGRLAANGEFSADTILAKHDENYVPRELADTLNETPHAPGAKDSS